MFVARMSLWVFAVFAAMLPIIVIAARPDFDIGLIFNLSSYTTIRRDFSLSAIAILAIGFLDAGEVIMACRNEPDYSFLFFTIWPVFVTIVIVLMVFSILCGTSSATEAVSQSVFYLYYFSVMLSFISRLALVVAP